MGKIVGKNFLLALMGLFTFSFLGASSLKLLVTDAQGRTIKQAHVGHPFVIKVSMDGSQGFGQRPDVEGLDQFHITGRQTKMQMINGATTVDHIYYVTAKKAGSYTLGPATIVESGGKKQKSAIIKLAVVDGPPTATHSEAQDNSNLFFARLVLDQERVVIGDKLNCSLQIYSRDPDIEIHEIKGPDLSSFNFVATNGPVSAVTYIDNVKYTCLEWQWELHPKKVGPIAIPACGIDFLVPVDYGMFFLRPQFTQKRIYSNAVTLTVDPLPAYNGTVHAVGRFKSCSLSIKPTVAKTGEGMVLTLEVEGIGDLKNINAPTLSMPSVFSCYESKNYVGDKDSNGFGKKYFEYIVQGLQPGEWEIPSQNFTYFDTKTRSYATLSTSPVHVTIVASGATAQPTIKNSNHSSPNAASILQDSDNDIAPLHQDGSWYPRKERALPWWVFIMFLSFPIFWLFLRGLHARYWKVRSSSKKQNVAHARALLKHAERSHQPAKIYAIFVDFFAQQAAIEPSLISQDYIEQYLQLHGYSEHHCLMWNSFFNRINELAFYQREKMGATDIFAQAYRWLDNFEMKL